ncbi:hypothetical protein D9757_007851 [Collybiopsis confluens]|uniref:Xylanolytic transcriptional activator regulatory domain-containing protein n=1 Tax=Collybiopsis confluens TaxID=2823264 RepID=A0A8H5HDJ3_9AGAR|nr:hypothetical protein D9757_007851 [Collybiopsis confluens]
MSDIHDDGLDVARKKRRLRNACDECRKRKVIAQSGSAIPAQTALLSVLIDLIAPMISFCLEAKSSLGGTPATLTQRLRRPPGERSIRETVDAILSTRHPFRIPRDETEVRRMLVDLATFIDYLEEDNARLREQYSATSQAAVPNTGPIQKSMTPVTPSDSSRPSDTYSIDDLTEDIRSFEFDNTGSRFFGTSSSNNFVKTAFDLKKEYARNANLGKETWVVRRRPEFWTVFPWQTQISKLPALEFPPDDLLHQLIEYYLYHMNHILPFFDRSTFTRSVAEGLHLRNRSFGNLVLAVCAVGARFSNDPRVFEEGIPSEHSIGWKWIRQIQPLHQTFIDPPSIYDIQTFLVYSSFMACTSTPELCWILVSVGVRLLQDVGAHRKNQGNSKPTAETESWKRAFWYMYIIDIFASTFLGRPRCLSQSDFDADLPVECDEEFWEHQGSEMVFRQPPGKPSTMTYWVCFIKLMHILGRVLQTVYAIDQPDVWSAMGLSKLEWNEKIVADLDSSLNEWTDSIPEYLKWDPNREDREHFTQSAMLYLSYYLVQILVHRHFIPGPGENSVLSFPSLAICANAARSCLHVLEVQDQRHARMFIFPNVSLALFNSVIVLLVNTWRGRHSQGLSSRADVNNELDLIYRSVEMLEQDESRLNLTLSVTNSRNSLTPILNRWQSAGRMRDVLKIVLSHHHELSHKISLKRRRESGAYGDDDDDDDDGPSPTVSKTTEGQRRMNRNNRSFGGVQDFVQNSPFPPTTAAPNLPLHTKELGSFPISDSFDLLSWVSLDGSSSSSVPPISPLDEPQFSQVNQLPYPEGYGLGGMSQHLTFDDTRDNGDWSSYMTNIDEVLQSVNYRI